MQLPPIAEITTFFPKQEDHVIQNLLICTQGIYAAKSSNLNEVKDELGVILGNQSTTKPESNYQRLVRFFNIPDEEKVDLVKSLLFLSFYLLKLKGRKPKYLALDGTSWEYGVKKIHLLTLSVVINGVSIPIWWKELDKKGTSNTVERKELMNEALKMYDLRGMILLADREYIGEQWFNYLEDKGLRFVIRLKKGVYKDYIDQQRQGYDKDYKHQKWRYIGMEREAAKSLYETCGVAKKVTILGKDYTFVIFKNPKADAEEPLVYFLSTLKKKKKIVKAYPIRWTIETCFKHLKSNGFNLEALNFKKSEKIQLMMGIVCFLYVLCIGEGWLQYRTMKKSDWKRYADGSINLAVSVFRKGRSYLTGKLSTLKSFLKYLKRLIKKGIKPSWVKMKYIVKSIQNSCSQVVSSP